MTAKKTATKKAAPRKRAAKKTVVHPLPVLPESSYSVQEPFAQDNFGQNTCELGYVEPKAVTVKLTWWQRFMAKIDAIIDGHDGTPKQ